MCVGLTMLSRGSTAQVLQWLPEALLPQPGPQSPPADLVAGEHTSTIGITLSVIRHAYTPFIAPAPGTSLLFQSLQPYPAGTAIRGDLQLMVPQQRRDTAARWPRHTVGGSHRERWRTCAADVIVADMLPPACSGCAPGAQQSGVIYSTSATWFVWRPGLPTLAPRAVRLTAISVASERVSGSAIAVVSQGSAVFATPGALTAGAPVPVPALSPQHLRRKGIDADLQTNADGVHRARGLHRVRAENPHTLITG